MMATTSINVKAFNINNKTIYPIKFTFEYVNGEINVEVINEEVSGDEELDVLASIRVEFTSSQLVDVLSDYMCEYR